MYTAHGQMNLSCAQCHHDTGAGAGARNISRPERRVSDLPARMETMGSLTGVFAAACRRAREIAAAGSPEFLVRVVPGVARGGLPVETPGVRR